MTSCPVVNSRCTLIQFNMQLIVVVAVRVCGTASTPGANGKQGLCGRCLCSELLCFPSSHSSEGLFSLLRHSDDTANQRVSCFVSLTKRTKNISSSTCCIMFLNHVLRLSLLCGLLKKLLVTCRGECSAV